jgi:hypothetical protein
MKFLLFPTFLCLSLISFAQADNDQGYTLNPTTSRIIGGFFSFEGQGIDNSVRTGRNNHSINVGPLFSLKRTEKRDILLVTNLLYQFQEANPQTSRVNRFVGTVGVDFRHQLYAFNRFKIFGSYGPRIGGVIESFNRTTQDGLILAATGNVSFALELAPNVRLLTTAFTGLLQFSRTVDDLSVFNYRIRNTIVSPNFAIEYILPSKA